MTADATHPVIVVDPRRQFGRPLIGGTSTETIADMVAAGDSVDVVCDEFDLTRHQVLLACWHEGLQGTDGRRRRAWHRWANDAHAMLGGHMKPFDLDAIPDPPVKTR
jgi:uncharacterized protein (DUF433 family)